MAEMMPIFCLFPAEKLRMNFFLSHDFTVHETLERSDASVYFFFFKSVHLADEVEVFFRREVVYQETVVYESAGKVFPVFAFVIRLYH